MIHRSLAGFLALSFVSMFSVGVVVAGDADTAGKGGRRLDIEAAVGAIIGAESDAPVDDNLLYGGAAVLELCSRVDAELGVLVGDTKVSGDSEEHQTVNYVYGGFRYYPYFDPHGVTRPYLLVGATEFWGLEPGEAETGLFVGPGIRFQPGETFGFTVKYPLVVALTGGDTNTMMLPNFNFYWQFNLGGGKAN